MDYILDFLSNRFFLTAMASWTVAQVLKVFIHAIVNKTWDITRLFGDGGMPSGHSATVTAMAISCGMVYGFDSGVFAIAAVVAIVVMHDASGVRLETGRQAKVINELMDSLKDSALTDEEKLKEFVGHTPLQVLCGAALGVVMAVAINLL